MTTSSLMSTVWLGSVDTLISMIRSALYAMSKCTARRYRHQFTNGSFTNGVEASDDLYKYRYFFKYRNRSSCAPKDVNRQRHCSTLCPRPGICFKGLEVAQGFKGCTGFRVCAGLKAAKAGKAVLRPCRPRSRAGTRSRAGFRAQIAALGLA